MEILLSSLNWEQPQQKESNQVAAIETWWAFKTYSKDGFWVQKWGELQYRDTSAGC